VGLGLRIGARDEDAPARHVGKRGPHLLPVDDEFFAVAHGTRLQRREVAAGTGLAEELAPDLGAVEDAR
jgi:hypothetical protein